MDIYKRLVDSSITFFHMPADQRLTGYPLMTSSIPSGVLCSAYIFISTIGGPWFMKNREPYNCRRLMLIYNTFMVLFSALIFYEFGMAGWFTGYSLGCQPVDYSHSPKALRMVRVTWLFFFSKYIEMIDTMFFIARKKFNQVTFLHVFHHGVLPFWWWFGIRTVPGGFGTFHAMINAFVHFVMYTYYAIAALGPQYQKYLWWKKYMTRLQIIQFIIVVVHSSQLLFIDCPYPGVFVFAIAFYQLLFLILFSNFYIQSYIKSKKSTKPETNGAAISNGSAKKHAVQNGIYSNGKANSTYQNGSVRLKDD